MQNVVCVGGQWGDEGKGKIVDLLAKDCDVIVRFQGGNNAGHTLHAEGKKIVLHLIPSGALHDGKQCVIGNGVVVDPFELVNEVELLQESGFLKHEQALCISPTCHVILPLHRMLDKAREDSKGKDKIGTTLRGIGPAYENKIARRGLLMYELLDEQALAKKVRSVAKRSNRYFSAKSVSCVGDSEIETMCSDLLAIGQRLKPFISNVHENLHEAISSGKRILFEGAQGALLDLDHGTYPFVTSSNCVAGHAAAGSGVGPKHLGKVVMVAKAYLTRVGAGPFPTELKDDMGSLLREKGAEFGATTGRPRRCGWLDLVALKHAVQIHGADEIALTKLDVLSGFDNIQLCTAYEVNGKKVKNFPWNAKELENAVPVYEEHEGFGKLSGQTLADLPAAAANYVKAIEAYVGIPCSIIGTGPKREEVLVS